MSYLVLARKWRPQQLSEVLGQEHVTRTLKNAFASGRIAQTFLFSGPRGVGKTSAARILAKALCCESSDGPTSEPCGVCRQCVAITEGTSTDVIEIDAASHTGVDNVREVIIEAVRYLPSSARYKVYIIDEVHMLSGSSFNALLKTFEEPPPHVKFVLATTDVHRVPITILSRCQRYDFRLIAGGRIQARLSEILDAEGIDHDPGALALVARFADGSMRDAQSLLEQVLAFAGSKKINAAVVREALGAVDAALIHGTFEAIFARRPDDVLLRVGEVHERGLGHARFAGSLVEHARDLVVARAMKAPDSVIDRPEDEVRELVSQAAAQSEEALERLFEALCRLQEEVARTPQPRYALEVGLASLAAQPLQVPVSSLMEQLGRIERLLEGGGGDDKPASRGPNGRGPRATSGPSSFERGPRMAPGRPAAGRPSGRSKRSGPGGGRDEKTPDPDPASSPPPEPTKWSGSGGGKDEKTSDPGPLSPDGIRRSGAGGGRDEKPPELSPPAPRPVAAVGTEEPPLPAAPPPWLELEGPSEAGGTADHRAPPPQSSPPPSGARAETEPVPDRKRPPPSSTVESDYRRFVQTVARRRPALGATLHQVRPLDFTGFGVRLVCETAFDNDKLAEPDTRKALTLALDNFFGASVPLSIERAQRAGESEPEAAPRTLVEIADQERAARVADKEARARGRPAVKAVERELGASIARVRVLGEQDEG